MTHHQWTLTHPMVDGACEGWPFLHVGFEELVREVLGEEGEHEAGALWVGNEVPPQQQLLRQLLGVGQLLLTYNQEALCSLQLFPHIISAMTNYSITGKSHLKLKLKLHKWTGKEIPLAFVLAVISKCVVSSGYV